MDESAYLDIVRRLVTMMASQDQINERLTASIESHTTHLERIDTAIERIDTAIEGINTTLARVETLLARIIPQSENGREA